jgi:uncharacterized phage protein gp47/JayE
MSFTIPTLAALRQQCRTFFAARLKGADPTLRVSNLNVSADSTAGAVWLQWQYLVQLAGWLLPDTLKTAFQERWASIFGLRRLAGAAAAGNVIFTGLVNTAVPAGFVVQTTDQTQSYATTSAGTIGASLSLSLPALAQTAGSAGNLPAFAPLTPVLAIAGLAAVAQTDGSGFTGGTDAESNPALRTRLLARIANPPQGGAASDYLLWAALSAGVTRAWVYPLYQGPGSVGVTCVYDDRADIFPLAADLATVQASLDALAPVTAVVIVWGLAPYRVAVSIGNLVPNTSAVQAAIQASLAALFAASTPLGASLGPGVTTKAAAGTVPLEAISAAIAASPGVQSFDLLSPTADVVAAAGMMPALGAVTIA